MVLELSLATWLITTFTSVLVSATAVFLKDCMEEYKRSQEEIRKRIDINNRAIPSQFKAIYVPLESIVPNEKVVNQLTTTLNQKIGGLFVVGAPTGAGKTSYLSQSICKFKKKNNRPVYYISGFHEDCLESLGIPRGRMIHEYIDSDSVIVIDQVEIDADELTANLKQILVQLATQSRNSRKFHAVIIVSKPKLMEKIINLNGGEKIYAAISFSDFQWDKVMMANLAKSLLPAFNDDDIESFVTIFESSKTPGLLFSYANTVKNYPSFGTKNHKELLAKAALKCKDREDSWSAFNDLHISVYEEGTYIIE